MGNPESPAACSSSTNNRTQPLKHDQLKRETASEALERESEKGVMTTSPEVTEQPKEKCPIN